MFCITFEETFNLYLRWINAGLFLDIIIYIHRKIYTIVLIFRFVLDQNQWESCCPSHIIQNRLCNLACVPYKSPESQLL